MAEQPRILLVDDEPSIVKMVGKRLEVEGYEVLVAMDGQEAVDKTRAAAPNLIILDLMLPKLNGYEVCRALKHQPQTAHIPVIVFSASESQMQKMADRCIEVGASDWIKKPFRTMDLMSKIRHALGEQEESNE